MKSNNPRRILCAVRGRPGSQTTADRATDLAIEGQARLTFLLVIDAQFMSRAGHSMSPLRIVYDQLEAMGDFAMAMLVERAQDLGAETADYVIRRGRIPQEIRAAAREIEPDLLVLGRPVQPAEHARFGQQEFDHFVEQLAQETDVKIEIVTTADQDEGKGARKEDE